MHHRRPDEQLVRTFAQAARVLPGLTLMATPTAIVPGSTPAEADAMVEHLLTSAPARLTIPVGAEQEPLPGPGGTVIVCDGSGRPQALARVLHTGTHGSLTIYLLYPLGHTGGTFL